MEKSISEKLTQYLGIAAGITAGVKAKVQKLLVIVDALLVVHLQLNSRFTTHC
jgi:hypothetical protein